MVTLKDIARSCGVSVSTVSRAFDENSAISQPVRQRILQCAGELGYMPNLIARSLQSRRTMTIAFVIPSIDNSFYIEVLRHLEIKLHRYGYRLMVSFIHDDISTEQDCLEVAAAAQVDGIIFIPNDRRNEQYVHTLQKNTPMIQLFHAPYEELDSVVVDDDRGAQDGARYLLERNHRRLLFICSDSRAGGFLRALEAANVAEEDRLILPCQTPTDILCETIRCFRPTAIFSVAEANETAWSAVQKMGLSIPKDVSMIAYDNTKWVDLIGLTAIAHDLENIAATVVDQLLKRLEGDTAPAQHLVLSPFIVARNSVSDRSAEMK